MLILTIIGIALFIIAGFLLLTTSEIPIAQSLGVTIMIALLICGIAYLIRIFPIFSSFLFMGLILFGGLWLVVHGMMFPSKNKSHGSLGL